MAVHITCGVCIRDEEVEKPFQVPYDDDGAAAMKVHLAEHTAKGEE